MRCRLLSSVVSACLLVGALPAGSQAASDPCRVGAPLVDVTQGVLNVVDVGLDGHVWALDDYASQIRLWRTGPDTYCAIERAVGTFTAFAGPSPALTGTVRGGRRGVFAGTTTYRVTGDFVPKAPTHGSLGLIDAGCDRDENCASFDFRFTERYFASVESFDISAFGAVYASPGHGRWVQTSHSSSGDILG